MQEKTQQRLETIFSTGIGIGLTRLVAERFIEDLVPEQRGIKDDVTRALLKATTTALSGLLASVIVRQIVKTLD